MFKLPIKNIYKPILTQPYGNTSNNSWYAANGVTAPYHNGADFIASYNPVLSYGTPLVCPFPNATVVKVTWDTPLTTKGNGVTIQYNPAPGEFFQLVYWHTGEIAVKVGQIIKEGDVVCYMGNSGLCSPARTTEHPYDGTHLHMMIFHWKDNKLECYDNGVLGAQDPAKYFDYNTWYQATEDSGFEHDKAPIEDSIKGLDIVSALQRIMKFFNITK